MYVNSNHFDNQNAALSAQQKDSKLKAELIVKYTPKPFFKRTAKTKSAAVFISYLSNAVSFASGSIAGAILLKELFAQALPAQAAAIISILISCAALAGLEAAKREQSNNFYQSVLQFKQLKAGALIAKISIIALSVSISIFGGNKAPEIAQEAAVYAVLLNTDSIANIHNKAITKAEIAASSYFEANKKKNNFGGFRISSRLQSTYSSLLKDISKAKEYKQQALAASMDNNRQAKQEAKAATEANVQSSKSIGFYLAVLCLTFEFLFECSMLFIHFWEIEALKYFATNEGPTAPRAPAQEEPAATAQEEQAGPKQEEPAATAQEEQAGPAPFILIDGYKDNVFNMQRINQFLSSYKSRLNNWEYKKAKGGIATEGSKETIIKNIAKWSEYKKQLTERLHT